MKTIGNENGIEQTNYKKWCKAFPRLPLPLSKRQNSPASKRYIRLTTNRRSLRMALNRPKVSIQPPNSNAEWTR